MTLMYLNEMRIISIQTMQENLQYLPKVWERARAAYVKADFRRVPKNPIFDGRQQNFF
jgi:hypothetical protein